MNIIAIIIATTLYAAVHSLLATLGAKARAHQWFGPTVDRLYRLAYNIFAFISFLPILWLLTILPDQPIYSIPFPWILLTGSGQITGAIIIVVGIMQTGVWSFIGIQQLVSPANPGSKEEMVIHGLYHWIRHPLYTGGLLLIWLTPVMTANTLILTIVLSLYLVLGAKFEERRLLHKFGKKYADYQQRVPMLIPWIKLNRNT